MRDINVFKAIGPRMEAARLSSGVTLRDASISLGLSKSTMYRIERAETDAPIGVLVNMATLYGVSTDYLLFGREQFASCPAHGRTECKILFMPRAGGALNSAG